MMAQHSRRQTQAYSAGERANNRTTGVVTVVLLLLIVLIVKLAYLQIFRHDHYVSAATSQHQSNRSLLPARGEIYIQENIVASADLYPIALNKDFASLFAIPRDIDDPADIAEKLYLFFREAEVKKEVELRLEREREDRLNKELAFVKTLPEAERPVKEAEVRATHEKLLADPVYLDFENQKRDELIKEQHELIVKTYTDALNKIDDQYEPIEKKLTEEKLKEFYLYMLNRSDITINDLDNKDQKIYVKSDNSELKLPGFGYTMNSFRLYPEKNIGAHILGFSSYEDDQEQHGKYGLEGFFDDDLFGKYGSVRSERGAGGLMIVNDRQAMAKVDGKDLILTIDRSAQFTACQALNEAVAKHGAEGGSVIIIDPKTGAILAMCSAPDFDPNNYRLVKDISVYNNPAIFDQYEPGSVFKAVTMAAALDQKKVTPETKYEDKGQIMIPGWPKPIKNSDFETHGGHGITSMVTVLQESLNTGAIFAMEQIGVKKFSDYVEAFGFGEKTGIELEGESAGNISSISGGKVKEVSAATASFGQGITVTPLQMVMAYAAIANGGKLLKPYIVKEIINQDGQRTITTPASPRRVISEQTASLLTGMLINVVEQGHSKALKTPGYYIAGKTGTAQVASSVSKGYSGAYNHTFIGYAPANNPQFVILTKINNPKDARFAESTAVPLARDITRFLLNHWEIKKDRPEDNK